MDKKGKFHIHSKIKLELYRLYLERYLAVLLNTTAFKSLCVHDIFAGIGRNEKDQGSAIIGALEVQKAQENAPAIDVKLSLNEKDTKKFSALKTALSAYDAFTTVTNKYADDYISEWKPEQNSHNLFFIDPHGYTQISSENLSKLFTTSKCDFLIFVPIYHIYRFLKPSEGLKDDGDDDDFFNGFDDVAIEHDGTVNRNKYFEPIAKFLAGLGIEREEAEKANSVEEFEQMIIDALKRISGSDFVYAQMIKQSGKNSKYSLFFITQHILGAEKFLEAKQGVQGKIRDATNESQQAFDFSDADLPTQSITEFVNYDVTYDNVSLYELGIRSGVSLKALKFQIAALEKKGEVTISSYGSQKRKGDALYIGYKYFKEQDKRILFRFSKSLELKF